MNFHITFIISGIMFVIAIALHVLAHFMEKKYKKDMSNFSNKE